MPRGTKDEQPQQERAGLGAVLTSPSFAVDRGAEAEAEADRALERRPAFSIRAALLVAFASCFLLVLAPTLWSIQMLSGVEDRVLFLEVADDYMAEIQQARRYEKNYLLYGTDLGEALVHTHRAQQLDRVSGDKMRKVLGAPALRTMRAHLEDYEGLLRSRAQSKNHRVRTGWEAELREHGARMIDFAQSYVRSERAKVGAMISLAKKVPFIFLGLLLAVIVAVASFLIRRILSALSRFTEYADRIGRGDFTPIMPARRYRDEFTRLAVAFNHMTHELDRRHQVLVESHKLRALGTLVAGVAHEINNPLNNIMLTVGVLKEEYTGLSDAEKLEMLDELIGQAERSRKIVRNLLDFARESETKLEMLDLTSILAETLRLVGNQLKVKKIRLSTAFLDAAPPVHGDRQLLGEVFMNLVINAIDAMQERGELKISVDENREEGFVAVDVSDDGPGIPEHILGRIFDPFFTTKPKGKGTGLGLSVAQGIVRKLGGDLRASSKLGRGATFTVLLPVTSVPSEVSSRVS